MKNGNWIPIDKNSRYLLPKNRPYTKIEAMISYTIDVDENTEKTLSDYARIWDWSRNKVRLFIENIRTGKGQVKDREGTGKGHTFRHIINNLEQTKDDKRTDEGQAKDRQRTTTIKPNPKPNPKEKKEDNIPYPQIVEYLNQTCSTSYKSTSSKTRELIRARWNEGFTLEDFKKVIDNKYEEWRMTDMQIYLRPETLFSNKFEGYLNQMPKVNISKKGSTTAKTLERWLKKQEVNNE